MDVIAILARRMPESLQELALRGMLEKHVARRALFHLSDMASIIRRNNISNTKIFDATAPFETAAIKLFEFYNDLEVLVSENSTETLNMEEVRKYALKQLCGKLDLGRAVLIHKWYETFRTTSAEGANADGEVQFVSQKRACDWNKDPAILSKAVNLCDDEPAPPDPRPSSGRDLRPIDVIDVDNPNRIRQETARPSGLFGRPNAASPLPIRRTRTRIRVRASGGPVKRLAPPSSPWAPHALRPTQPPPTRPLPSGQSTARSTPSPRGPTIRRSAPPSGSETNRKATRT